MLTVNGNPKSEGVFATWQAVLNLGLHYLRDLQHATMSERVKKIASRAPPPPKALHGLLVWLENNVRKPLEGTTFDEWIAKPAKEYYIATKRLE